MTAKLLRRPELGAAMGLAAVIAFFAVSAQNSGMFSGLGILSILRVSAELAILAVPVALLMIGGDFDLSLGSMVAFSGMVLALGMHVLGLTLASALLLAGLIAALLGALNGWLVVRTGLPSFIVTLASMFVLRGLTLGGTRALTGRTALTGLKPLFADDPVAAWLGAGGFAASLLWALGVLVAAAFVLHRTPFGNWACAVGGDAEAAASVGVPVARVKIILFTATALAAFLVAALQVVETGSADTNRGLRDEFEAIIAAVIGGTLLSGGHGTVIGAALGALLFGVVQIGIFHTGADTDWFELFLGLMLLAAVVFNETFRRRVLDAR
ncbi:MAG: ABC transporter permease [Myxococcota bacterium]